MNSIQSTNDLLDKLIISDKIKNLKGVHNQTFQQDLILLSNYILKLQSDLKAKDMELFNIQELLDTKNLEMKEYDKILGYTTDMTIKQKKQHSKKCDKNQKKIDDIAKDLSPELKDEYYNDLKLEQDIVDLALQQNQLQFEIHEHFSLIKSFMIQDNYELYKTFKRDFLKQINTLYKNIKDEHKSEFFDNLVDIVEKEGQVYQIDEDIKNIK